MKYGVNLSWNELQKDPQALQRACTDVSRFLRITTHSFFAD